MIAKHKRMDTKRIVIYLAIVLGFYFFTWLLAVILPGESGTSIKAFLRSTPVFMGTPALATAITRKITNDKSPWNIDIKVWRNWRMLLFSAVIPATAIFLGAVIFYLVFPNDLDFSGTYITQNYAKFGAPTDISLSVGSMLLMGLIILIISAVAIPIWFIALGEDIGWQGYLLPLLCKKLPVQGAVLLNGTLWGMGHAPLIYFGLNYGTDYAGAPFAGIFMMILVCIVLGIWLSYVTLKTENCMYAAIIHGSVDVIGETAIFVSLSTQSPLLGPNPTGVIGLSVLFLVAVALFMRMKNMSFIKLNDR